MCHESLIMSQPNTAVTLCRYSYKVNISTWVIHAGNRSSLSSVQKEILANLMSVSHLNKKQSARQWKQRHTEDYTHAGDTKEKKFE